MLERVGLRKTWNAAVVVQIFGTLGLACMDDAEIVEHAAKGKFSKRR